MEFYLNEKVLCTNYKYVVSYKKGFIIIRKNDENLTLINKKKIGTFLNKFTILSRLMRLEPRCAIFVNEYTCIISHNGIILNLNITNNTIKTEYKYDKNMQNPLNFSIIENQEKEKNVFFGEYIWNKDKGPVAIYKREKEWKKVYEFNKNTITHIHNIIYDKYRNCVYILTGDSNNESGIWMSDIEFKNVKPLIKGKQLYRSCIALPTPKGLLYCTDTPLEKNYVVELIIENEKCKKIEKIHEIPGPCIYGIIKEDKLFFATSVEPDSTLNKWRYKITYKLGKGIANNNSHIICVDKEKNIFYIEKQKKDILPIWLFQFGNFQFVNTYDKKILVTTQALKCGHCKTYKLKCGDKNEK